MNVIFGLLTLLSFPALAQESLLKDRDITAPQLIRAEDVSYWNVKDSVKLNATLTLPAEGKRFPAVVLITGSGPQDRDETMLGHKPFKVIAEYLSNRGFAVLRYDDRGGGRMNDVFTAATIDNFVTDAEAGVNFLKTRPDIDRKKIGLLGHSEGGSVAPALASGSRDVAFLVLMAAPGAPHLEMMVQQNRDLFRAMKMDSAAVETYLDDYFRVVFPKFIETSDTAVLARTIRERIGVLRTKLSKEQLFLFGIPPKEDAYVQTVLKYSSGDWFRRFLSFDPGPYLQKVRVPVLAVNGSKDLQVNADLNLSAIEANLKKAGNRQYQIVKLDGLNHLMQTAKSGMPAEYATIKEDVSPLFLQTIGDWLVRTMIR